MKKYVFLLMVSTLFFSNCKKEELMSFTQSPLIYVYKYRPNTDKDSITYSFAIKGEDRQVDTIYIPLRISGDAMNRDRLVNYNLMTDISVNIDDDSYEFLPAIVPANSFTGKIPVKVKRGEKIATKEMRLWIKLESSDDFGLGPKDQLTYLIKVNDFYSRPNSWNDAMFGTYNRVKYITIIEQTGYTEFSSLTYFELVYITQTCKGYLYNYEQTNGKPLKDENGVDVKFP